MCACVLFARAGEFRGGSRRESRGEESEREDSTRVEFALSRSHGARVHSPMRCVYMRESV